MQGREKEQFYNQAEAQEQVVENRESQETDREVVEKAQELFSADLREAGETIRTLQSLDQTDSQVQELNRETESTFRSFYRNVKKLLPGLPLMFLQTPEQPPKPVTAEDLRNPTSHVKKLNRDELPYSVQFADWYYDGEFLKIYNDFVDHKNNRVDGKMTPEEIAFKERIARNVEPYGYGSNKDILDRVEAYQKDEGKYSKENLESTNSPDSPMVQNSDPKLNLQVRNDLFRKYLGLEQNFGTLQDSPYKPTKAKNPEAVYSSFDTKKLVDSIKKMNSENLDSTGKREGYMDDRMFEASEKPINSFEDLKKFVEEKKTIPSFDYTNQLRNYITDVGYDEERKESYISYYDVWDVDPPALKEMNIDVDQFNYPFEIYGRIYESDFEEKKLPE